MTDPDIDALLTEIEAEDRPYDTVPEITLGGRMIMLEGCAQISATTLKIDQLLRSPRVQSSAVFSNILTRIKLELLQGLRTIQEGANNL